MQLATEGLYHEEQKFAANFLLFQVFCSKNAENDYFDQHLECAAPKRWSKNTTMVVKKKLSLEGPTLKNIVSELDILIVLLWF